MVMAGWSSGSASARSVRAAIRSLSLFTAVTLAAWAAVCAVVASWMRSVITSRECPRKKASIRTSWEVARHAAMSALCFDSESSAMSGDQAQMELTWNVWERKEKDGKSFLSKLRRLVLWMRT